MHFIGKHAYHLRVAGIAVGKADCLPSILFCV